MLTKLLNHYFVIFFALAVGISNVEGQNDWSIGQRYIQLRSEISKIGEQALIQESSFLATQPSLKAWALLLRAEGLIANRRYEEAKEALTSIPPTGATALHAKALSLEIAALTGQKITKEQIKLLQLESEEIGLKELRSKLLLLEAITLNQSGQLELAIGKLQEIRKGWPQSIEAKKAKQFQSFIAPALSPAPKLAYWLNEIEILRKELDFSELEPVARQLWDDSHLAVDGEQREAVLKARLIALKNLGRTEEAALLLSKLSAEGSPYRQLALKQLALNAWQRNDYPAALSALSSLPSSLPIKRYISARISEERGELETAVIKYKQIVGNRDKEYGFTSALRLYPLLLSEQDWSEASRILKIAQHLLPADASRVDAESLDHWLSVAHRNMGAPGGRIFNKDPRSYYYWLSRGTNVVSAAAQLPEFEQANCQPIQRFVPTEQVTVLSRYGLLDLASQEIRASLPAGSEAAPRAELFARHGRLSDAIGEIAAVERQQPNLFEGGCATKLMEIIYPRPYQAQYSAAAKANSLDLALLYAISRTESLFEPFAVSRANALGLMQLLPKSAEMEGLIGATKDPTSIFNPDNNIALGAKHIKRALDRFDGKLYLAIAAYNAGPEAVQRWLKRIPDTWPELWIETIPYKETRDYVRKVLSAYWVYKELIALN